MEVTLETTQPHNTETSTSSNLKWWVLVTVIVGTFLGRLDQTIVNLALPKIISDFGITVSAAGWIATAYILANAIFVPIWGKLGDTIGRKKVYILGFTIFIIGSVLAGLSWNLSSMIAFRVIQAVASSADYPTAMAILAVTFPGQKERAQALGIWSSSFAAAAVFGPLIGGPLIDNFGWRSVFLVNLPVGLVGLFMAITFVRESVSEHKTYHFDWWGAITLGVALSALVLVLDQGTTWGWMDVKSWICYIMTVAFTLIFIRIEHNSPEPIVDLKFFKIAAFNNTLINNFIIFMGLMGGLYLIPIFSQTYLGYDATKSGLLFIPMAVAIMVAAPIGGSLIGRVRPGVVIAASTLVGGIGILMLKGIDATSTAQDIIWPLVVMAFGVGFGMAQRTNIIASVVDQHEIGIASSVLALARNVAGAFGVAVFATILTDSTNRYVMQIGQRSILRSTNPTDYQTFIQLIILKSQVQAYDFVFIVAAVLIFIGAVTALWIRVSHERTDVHVMVE